MNLLCSFLSARSRLRTRRTFANCGMLRVICWAYSTALLLLAIHGPPAVAEEAPAAIADGQVPAQRVVLRVSEGMLNTLWGNQTIDRQADVRDYILGTSIYGRARVVGTSRVQLAESPDQARLQMIFQGTAHSRTTGYNGPAIIYSRAVTAFTATKQIIAEPGEGFRTGPSQVWARTQTFVEGIGSTRGGLVGRIVQRRAARSEAELHAEATEIARQKTARRVAVALDRTSEERLARLNWLSRLRSVAAMLLSADGSSEPRFAYSTTPQYLQIAASLRASGAPIVLPVDDQRATAAADAQIWFHESLGRNGRIVAAIDLVSRAVSMSDFLEVVSTTARVIGSRVRGNPLGPIVAEQPFRIRRAGDWRVIALEMPTDASRALVRAAAARSRPQSLAAVATTRPTRSAAPADAPAPRPIDVESPAPRTQPVPKSRIWTSGPYHADASFIALEGNVVRLLRTSGVRASIQFEKLSPADQQWITNYLAAE